MTFATQPHHCVAICLNGVKSLFTIFSGAASSLNLLLRLLTYLPILGLYFLWEGRGMLKSELLVRIRGGVSPAEGDLLSECRVHYISQRLRCSSSSEWLS